MAFQQSDLLSLSSSSTVPMPSSGKKRGRAEPPTSKGTWKCTQDESDSDMSSSSSQEEPIWSSDEERRPRPPPTARKTIRITTSMERFQSPDREDEQTWRTLDSNSMRASAIRRSPAPIFPSGSSIAVPLSPTDNYTRRRRRGPPYESWSCMVNQGLGKHGPFGNAIPTCSQSPTRSSSGSTDIEEKRPCYWMTTEEERKTP